MLSFRYKTYIPITRHILIYNICMKINRSRWSCKVNCIKITKRSSNHEITSGKSSINFLLNNIIIYKLLLLLHGRWMHSPMFSWKHCITSSFFSYQFDRVFCMCVCLYRSENRITNYEYTLFMSLHWRRMPKWQSSQSIINLLKALLHIF